jgi:hypothetical protein
VRFVCYAFDFNAILNGSLRSQGGSVTAQQVVGLAARLFAIWLLVITFQLFGIASALRGQYDGAGVILVYFASAFPILLAIVLWKFPMTIAHKIVPKICDENTLRMPAREAAAAASAIIGIWVLIGALPQIVSTIGLVLVDGGVRAVSMFFTQERMVQLSATALQCVIAAFLLAKPWWVAGKVFPSSAGSSR